MVQPVRLHATPAGRPTSFGPRKVPRTSELIASYPATPSQASEAANTTSAMPPKAAPVFNVACGPPTGRVTMPAYPHSSRSSSTGLPQSSRSSLSSSMPLSRILESSFDSSPSSKLASGRARSPSPVSPILGSRSMSATSPCISRSVSPSPEPPRSSRVSSTASPASDTSPTRPTWESCSMSARSPCAATTTSSPTLEPRSFSARSPCDTRTASPIRERRSMSARSPVNPDSMLFSKVGPSAVTLPSSKVTRMGLLQRSIISNPSVWTSDDTKSSKVEANFSIPATPNLVPRSISPMATSDSMPHSKVEVPASVGLSSLATPNFESCSVSARSSVATSDSMPCSKVEVPLSAGLTQTATTIVESCSISARSSVATSETMTSAKVDMPAFGMTCNTTPVDPQCVSNSSVLTSDGMPCSKVGVSGSAGLPCAATSRFESPRKCARAPKAFMPGSARSRAATPILVSRSISGDPCTQRTDSIPCTPKAFMAASAGRSRAATPILVSRSISGDPRTARTNSVPCSQKVVMPLSSRRSRTVTPILVSRSISADPHTVRTDSVPCTPKDVMPAFAARSRAATPILVSRSISADPHAVRTNSVPCSPKVVMPVSAGCQKVGIPASVGSSSTASPIRSRSMSVASSVITFDSMPFSKVGMPVSAGSSVIGTPLVGSLRMVAGSAVVTPAVHEVAPEHASMTASCVPNPVSEPAIFASYLVEKIIGNGSVPCIKRQVNSETGFGQTVVTDERGRTSTFSQETVTSVFTGSFRAARVLPDSTSATEHAITRDEKGCIKAIDDESIEDFFDETVMRSWMASLPKVHLMGFDQELRIRLSNLWTEYSKIKAEHEDYLENADLIFFGLDKNSTLNDLEKAFRRLAKMMHPDKNGGSDEAKARFQDLKERYEKLKRKMQGDASKNEEKQKELLDEGQEFVGWPDSDDDDKEDANNVEQDLDRDDMEKKIWEVIEAAKMMQRQMQRWKEQLDKAAQTQ